MLSPCLCLEMCVRSEPLVLNSSAIVRAESHPAMYVRAVRVQQSVSEKNLSVKATPASSSTSTHSDDVILVYPRRHERYSSSNLEPQTVLAAPCIFAELPLLNALGATKKKLSDMGVQCRRRCRTTWSYIRTSSLWVCLQVNLLRQHQPDPTLLTWRFLFFAGGLCAQSRGVCLVPGPGGNLSKYLSCHGPSCMQNYTDVCDISST